MANCIPSTRSLIPAEINRYDEKILMKMSLPRRRTDGKIHVSKHTFQLHHVSDRLYTRPGAPSDVESFEFSSGAGIENDKWILRLMLFHSPELVNKCILATASPTYKKPTRAICALYVVDNKQNEIFIDQHAAMYYNTFFPTVAHFLNKSLPEEMEQLVPKNTLTVRLQLTIHLDDITPLLPHLPIKLFPKAELPDNFKKLYNSRENDENTCDVQVEEKLFRVHKSVLELRCPKLLATLAQVTQHNNNNNFKVLDMDCKTFEKLLEFIYLDEVNDFDDCIVPLFIMAHKYELKSLKRICEKSICEDFLTVENADIIHRICVLLHSVSLHLHVSRFLNMNVAYYRFDTKEMIRNFIPTNA